MQGQVVTSIDESIAVRTSLPIARTDQWRVLLVEDDDCSVDAISMVLTDAGYLLSTCRNGRDALAAVKADPPDVIVLDLVMPVMNGWEFRAAQRADRAIADIPVLVVSADRSPKAIAVHADSYLEKPFDARALLQEVERILLERARQRQASVVEEPRRLTVLGQVGAGLGHDINNPLAFAIGSLELIDAKLPEFGDDLAVLRDGCRNLIEVKALARIEQRLESIHDLLRDGRTGADRIRMIVRNLQSLAPRTTDPRRTLDLPVILDRSISAASTRIKYCSKLVRNYHGDTEVWGSERGLTQLFLNLLVNATESIAPDRIESNTIRVSIDRDESWCIVEIRDSGSGMSSAVRRRIFEPFFTTKGREGGVGLGLTICRDIVEAHGGRIEAESISECGSTLRVRLPALANVGRPAGEFRPDSPTMPIGSMTTPAAPRLWVIDDERLVAKTVSRVLAQAYDIVILDDPREAVHRLEHGETFDALLCDLMMPGMSGMEVHARIAALRPDLLPRVIFMSGGASTSEGRQFAAQLRLPLIEKPFDATRLRAMLDAVTQRPS
jgi:two-component system NtrC family sensor kinase